MPDAAPTQPLLTQDVLQKVAGARDRGENRVEVSLDLGRSQSVVEPGPESWSWRQGRFPYPDALRERTVYGWNGEAFVPVSVFLGGLYKLVPTDWGPPTFEIDGIKMLPTAKVSPFEDARAKVALVAPRGKRVLDCCAGLGYFAHWCLAEGAASVLSFEKCEAVLWLRGVNPWSPPDDPRLSLQRGDVAARIGTVPDRSVDVILHDPPRFGIAGELYAQRFYDELARVIVPGGLLFHYTGTPNRLTSGRDVPREVQQRLRRAGFDARIVGDGLLARRVAARSVR